jgi:hypothetical protein
MGRPKGARNKLTVERENSARWLLEKFGDPVESILRRRNQLIEERDELLAHRAELLAAPSRHRRHQKIEKAEAKINLLDTKILAHNEASANYVRPRFQAITTQNTTAQVTVIKAPDTVSGTKEWLDRYGPKRDDDRPAVIPIVRNLKVALDTSDQLKIDSPKLIVDEAVKATENETSNEPETELQKLRSGKIW